MNSDVTPVPSINFETGEGTSNFETFKKHENNFNLKTSLLNNNAEISSDDDDEIQHNFAKMSKSFLNANTKMSEDDDDDDDQTMQTDFNNSKKTLDDDDDDGNFKIHFPQTVSHPNNLSTDDDDVDDQRMHTNFNNSKETSDDDDDDGNFKIHIAQTARDSNDDDYEDEAETLPDETIYQTQSTLTYSSQAESIFFGGEDKPVARPRHNFVFTSKDNDDDDNISEGSSASA